MSTQSVVTIPLKCEIWQADRLNKLFEIYRSIYNAMLGHELKQLAAMQRDPEYKKSKETIDNVYRIDDAKEKAEAKKSDEYKTAVETGRLKLKEYGMNEFAFIAESNRQRAHFGKNTASMIVGRSVGKPMWAAFDKLLFGNGTKVSFKKFGEWHSLVSDCKSGIRIVGDDMSTTIFTAGTNKKLFAAVKTAQGTMFIPVLMSALKKDDYKKMMLQREFRTARIVKKEVRGKSTFVLQLSVLGAPEEKVVKETGELKHPIGKGTVGIYIDTHSVTCCAPDGTITRYDLSVGIPNYEKEIAELQTQMDTSRRLSNPDNFNDDGTVKKGIVKNEKKGRLVWKYSKKYCQLKSKAKDLHRKTAESRTIQRHVLCNAILAQGDRFVANDYPFQAAAMRKKETEYSEKTGRPLSKAKGGKAIGTFAPAMLLTLMDNVLTAHEMEKVQRVRFEVDRAEEDYKKNYAVKLQSGVIK